MRNLKVITALLVLCVSGGIGWIVMGAFSSAQPAVTIAVSRTPLSAPIYIADSLGYFRSAGVNVELVETEGGNLCYQMMIDGKTDFATSSESVIMFNGFKRQDFDNLATFVRSEHDVKVVTKASMGITSARELQGRKVALIKGSASEYFLDMVLAIEGVELSHVELVHLLPKEMPLALERGEVDAIAVWEPYAYEAVTLLGEDAHWLPSKNLYELTFNLLARKQTVQNNQVAAEKIIRALKHAIEYINANPSDAQRMLRERLKLDQRFIEWIWQDYLFNLSLNRSLILSLENEARWAVDRGLTESKVVPDFRQLLNPNPLMSVSPHSVSL